VPKTNRMMSRTINQCQTLNEPMCRAPYEKGV
jgi:hypothetical protein